MGGVPGGNCTNWNFSRTGTWMGSIQNLIPALSAPSLESFGDFFLVRSVYSSGDCNLGATLCGVTTIGQFPPLLSPSIFLFPVCCLGHISGDAPIGECYSFMEQSNATAGPGGEGWALFYTTFSIQTDSSVYYTILQGMIPLQWGISLIEITYFLFFYANDQAKYVT